MSEFLYGAHVLAAAREFNLDPELLHAQILVESAGDPWAFRFEPDFWHHYLVPKGSALLGGSGPLLACSYGLLQPLLQVCRERGFQGHPEDLFDPTVNLFWGCTQLVYLRAKLPVDYDIRALLASYNGGLEGNLHPPYRNAAYAERVLAQRDATRAILQGAVDA